MKIGSPVKAVVALPMAELAFFAVAASWHNAARSTLLRRTGPAAEAEKIGNHTRWA
jgi:hypothetical protein